MDCNLYVPVINILWFVWCIVPYFRVILDGSGSYADERTFPEIVRVKQWPGRRIFLTYMSTLRIRWSSCTGGHDADCTIYLSISNPKIARLVPTFKKAHNYHYEDSYKSHPKATAGVGHELNRHHIHLEIIKTRYRSRGSKTRGREPEAHGNSFELYSSIPFRRVY